MENRDGGRQRRLAAIFSADVAGYSRLMGADEDGTLATLTAHRSSMDEAIARHGGRVVGEAGDSVLAEFPSAVAAVRCAIGIQEELHACNADTPADRRMEFRIGINMGDVIVDGDNIFGDGVNVAACLEKMAEPGGLNISANVFEQVRDRIPHDFEDLGEQDVKNITRPVRVYRMPLLDAERSAAAAAADPSAAPAVPDKPSVAVLPFANISADPEQEYFSDGITEDIITTLSKISGLFVIARNSVFTYKGTPVKVQDVGRDLGVRYILEGSVRKAGDRVRVTAQLIEAATGHHLWAERYDRKLEDIFAVQDELSQEIASALKVALSDQERSLLARQGTENMDAYDCLLRAKELWMRFTRESNAEARALYEQAVALDPNYAEAHAELARVCIQARNHGWSDSLAVALAESLAHAEKAVALDDSLPEAHVNLGFICMWGKDHSRALAEVEKGLALDPNHADGHMYHAVMLSFTGQPAASVRWVSKANRLNPAAPFWHLWALGTACFSMERYAEAVAAFKKAIGYNPHFIFARLGLAAGLGRLGKTGDAQAAFAECQAIFPDLTVAWVRDVVPYDETSALDRFIDGLSRAGLPDTLAHAANA